LGTVVNDNVLSVTGHYSQEMSVLGSGDILDHNRHRGDLSAKIVLVFPG
jgi:hypothetical protein